MDSFTRMNQAFKYCDFFITRPEKFAPIFFRSHELQLSPEEWVILPEIIRLSAKGRIATRKHLTNLITDDYGRDKSERSIDHHIKRIRRKLKQLFDLEGPFRESASIFARTKFIRTVYNEGYRLCPDLQKLYEPLSIDAIRELVANAENKEAVNEEELNGAFTNHETPISVAHEPISIEPVSLHDMEENRATEANTFLLRPNGFYLFGRHLKLSELEQKFLRNNGIPISAPVNKTELRATILHINEIVRKTFSDLRLSAGFKFIKPQGTQLTWSAASIKEMKRELDRKNLDDGSALGFFPLVEVLPPLNKLNEAIRPTSGRGSQVVPFCLVA